MSHKKLLLSLVAAGIVLAAAAGVVATRNGSGGPKLLPIERLGATGCFDGVANARGVRIKAPEAVLDGVVLGKGPVGILLAPQAGESLCEWRTYALYLAQKGYRVLALSFSEISRDVDDVLAAVPTLKALGAKKIVLFGASRGGTDVLAAAGKLPVAGVVALSPPTEWNGADAIAGVKASHAPLVIAVGRLDTDFAQGAIWLERHAAAGWKRLVVRPTGDHGVDLLVMDRSPVDDAIASLLERVRAS